jgi:hypothetical protein
VPEGVEGADGSNAVSEDFSIPSSPAMPPRSGSFSSFVDAIGVSKGIPRLAGLFVPENR